MLKLKAAFAKKIPADTEYSSQSYHCEIECEIPDGLTQQQLDAKVHGVFDFVRASVEKELASAATGVRPVQNAPANMPSVQTNMPPVQRATAPLQPTGSMTPSSAPAPQSMYTQPRRYGHQPAGNAAASPKQINFLLSLAKRSGWSVDRILQECGIGSLEELPKRTCSELIERFSQAA